MSGFVLESFLSSQIEVVPQALHQQFSFFVVPAMGSRALPVLNTWALHSDFYTLAPVPAVP